MTEVSVLSIKNQNGAIMVWMIFVIPIVLGILSFLYFNSSREVIRSQIQAIADSAALAGAKTLCSRFDCYDDVINVVRATLAANASLGLKNSEYLEIGPNRNNFSCDTLSPWWSNDNLKVSIQRGWWVKNDPDEEDSAFRFESMESDGNCNNDWSDTYPGVPSHVAANAVKIVIRVEEVAGIFGLEIGNVSGPVQVDAIAIAGPVEAVPIAPFALPVCALLDEEGEFQPGEICYGDRIFTRADRYMPNNDPILPISISYDEAANGIGPFADENEYEDFYAYNSEVEALQERLDAFNQFKFGVRPSFFYGPCSSEINECNIRRQLNTSFDKDNTFYPDEYATFGGWSNYAYSNLADHYGVTGTVSEKLHTINNFRNFIFKAPDDTTTGVDESNEKDVTASIKQKFRIKWDGFTEEELAEKIQYKIERANPHIESEKTWDFNSIYGKTTVSSNRLTLASLPDFPNLMPFSDQPFPASIATPSPAPLVAPTPDNLPDNHFHNQIRIGANAFDQNIVDDYPTYLRDQFSHGLCKSNRMKLLCKKRNGSSLSDDFSHCDLNLDNHFDPQLQSNEKALLRDYLGTNVELVAQPISNHDRYNHNLWQVKIPIIANANPNATPCEGLKADIGEPAMIKPSNTNQHDYIIIGFVTVNIFDYDIGEELPEEAPLVQTYANSYTPGTETDTVNTTNVNVPFYDYNAQNYSFAITASEPHLTPGVINIPFLSAPNQTTGPNPWHFQAPDGNGNLVPTACNMVRARVACDTNFIPSSINSGYRESRLVEE